MAVLTTQFAIVKTVGRFPGPAATLVAGLGLMATELVGLYQQLKHATMTYQLGVELAGLESKMDGMASKRDLVIGSLGENTTQVAFLSVNLNDPR